jgi:hypothetical protein
MQWGKCRILSMDGSSVSGGSGFVSAELLRRLDQGVKRQTGENFLREVNFYAGTSAGALNALFLAMHHEDPDKALAILPDFWRRVMRALAPQNASNPVRMLSALAGQSAVLSSAKLRQVLKATFGNQKLRDLKRPVMVTSFELDREGREARQASEAGPESEELEKRQFRSWKPKIFRNFRGADPKIFSDFLKSQLYTPETPVAEPELDAGPYLNAEPDLDEPVVDVALRACAPPLLMPMYQSRTGQGPCFIDGGIFGNNPALVAVAEVLKEMELGGYVWLKACEERMKKFKERKEAEQFQRVQSMSMSMSGSTPPELGMAPLPSRQRLQNVFVLSIGNGRSPTYLSPKTRHGMADWGAASWFLHPQAPFAFLDLVLESNVMATDHQCHHLLGRNYGRIDPLLPERVSMVGDNPIQAVLTRMLEQQNTHRQIARLVRWLTTDGMGDKGGIHKAWFKDCDLEEEPLATLPEWE